MNVNKHTRAWGMLGSLSLVVGGFGGCFQTFLTFFLAFPFLSFSWWSSIHWNDWRFVHQPFLLVRMMFPTHWHPAPMVFTFCVSCSPCYIFPFQSAALALVWGGTGSHFLPCCDGAVPCMPCFLFVTLEIKKNITHNVFRTPHTSFWSECFSNSNACFGMLSRLTSPWGGKGPSLTFCIVRETSVNWPGFHVIRGVTNKQDFIQWSDTLRYTMLFGTWNVHG